MRYSLLALTFVFGYVAAIAEEKTAANQPEQGWRKLSGAQTPESSQAQEADAAGFRVVPGTRILLSLINSVSTKNAAEGDRVYLETVFPIIVNGRIVIP